MINHIKLVNFRKFKNLEIDINKKIVVLHGSNAQGKSTILESIYLINNGKSPWASTDEYINTDQSKEVHTRIEIERDGRNYTYFKDKQQRIFKIDGKRVRSKTFLANTSATIFNPEKIELLMISPSQRRNFLDEVIEKYNYEYEYTLKEFKQVLRQRNAYLKKLAKLFYEQGIVAINDPQLNFWSKQFVEKSLDILQERINLTKELSKNGYDLKYRTGFSIDKRKISNREYLKEKLIEDLENSKRKDIATGYSNIGPHRDDWEIFLERDIKKFGSRGEKRLAIGALIFRSQEVIYNKTGYYPILLLDDIASELDTPNTKKIFNKRLIDKQQTFITVIDYKTLPKNILKECQLIHLNGKN
ncbi:MAG: DNA replication/repair protein RecF [Candidatus Dojkabacteria bacterium]